MVYDDKLYLCAYVGSGCAGTARLLRTLGLNATPKDMKGLPKLRNRNMCRHSFLTALQMQCAKISRGKDSVGRHARE